MSSVIRGGSWAELFRCATADDVLERIPAAGPEARADTLAAWVAARTIIAEAEKRLEARAGDLEALQAFGRGLAESRTIDELFDAAARGAESLLGLDAVVVASALTDRPSVRLWLSRPLTPEDARRLATQVPSGLLPADTPIADEERLPTFDRLQGVRPSFDDRELLAVPVLRRGREVVRLGALCRAAAGERDLRVLFGAASHIALHLERVVAATSAEHGRFRAILDSMPHAVVLLDAAFQVVHANAPAEPLVGRLQASGAMRSVGDLDLVGLAYDVLAGRRDASAAEAQLPDGTRLEVTVASWRDPAGDADGLVIVLHDVTTAVALRDQVARSERLSGLGRLLAGVAHELNNPLTAVIGYAQLLPSMAGEKQRLRLETMRKEAERCRRIVGGLLRFARPSAPERRAFSLNQVVADAAQLLAYAARSQGVGVELDLDPQIPAATGDAHELEQAVVNLVSNAQQAIAGASRPGTVTLRTSAGAGGGPVLEVEDDGPGIPEATRARIFDPFFTTKAAGQGTGLGLWLVYNAIGAHGGKIEVEASKTGGALFRLELPRGDLEPVAARPDLGPDDRPLVSARILVADPEVALAELICEALEGDGHEAVAARDADDALARLVAERFDLVISDALLPGLPAERLTGAIERHRPELRDRVLLTTGDWIGGEPEDAGRRHRVGLLRKPFEIDELRWAVRRHLS